jgi:hypothetical protein
MPVEGTNDTQHGIGVCASHFEEVLEILEGMLKSDACAWSIQLSGVMNPRTGLNATFALSGLVSVGSMIDVSWVDLIYHFSEDPYTSSILIYMESISDARMFLSAALGRCENSALKTLSFDAVPKSSQDLWTSSSLGIYIRQHRGAERKLG